jgi:hypothetical protein
MARRITPAFDPKEAAVLCALYEVENGYFNSYTLAQSLDPTNQPGTPQARSEFMETLGATEGLIARGLVGGSRNRGADGVYFSGLKLTRKGEQAAIEQQRQAKQTEKAIDEAAHEGNKIAREATGKK